MLDKTSVIVCGHGAAATVAASFPPPNTPEACLATTTTGSTLAKRNQVYSLQIGARRFTCNTDVNKNPFADCLNAMARICNSTDPTWSLSLTNKTRCQNGVNEMFGNMSNYWQNVRKGCGQWKWTDQSQSIGNNASESCTWSNTNLTSFGKYKVLNADGNWETISVTAGVTDSIMKRLWNNIALK